MSDDEPRFALTVGLIDREDTNAEGNAYVYRATTDITEREVRNTEYSVVRESPAWMLANRIVPELKERNGGEV